MPVDRPNQNIEIWKLKAKLDAIAGFHSKLYDRLETFTDDITPHHTTYMGNKQGIIQLAETGYRLADILDDLLEELRWLMMKDKNYVAMTLADVSGRR